MKAYLFGLVLLIHSYSGLAQVDNHPWCPSGATWLYQKVGFFSQDYIKLAYLKDTILAHQASKVLAVSNITVVGPGPLPNYAWSEQAAGYEYYAMRNDSIFRWHNGAFSFLYNFNSSVGHSWIITENNDYPCHGTTLPSTDLFTIDSIKNQTYDGFIFETIHGTDNNNWTIGQTIIKNIGSLRAPYPIPINNNCYGTHGATNLPLKLNCYSDDLRGSITFQMPSSNSCHFALTPLEKIPVTKAVSEISIFPNPTFDVINLVLSDKGTKVTNYALFNINGQKVQDGPLPTNKAISIQKQPKGIYFLVLNSTGTKPQVFKVIKL